MQNHIGLAISLTSHQIEPRLSTPQIIATDATFHMQVFAQTWGGRKLIYVLIILHNNHIPAQRLTLQDLLAMQITDIV